MKKNETTKIAIGIGAGLAAAGAAGYYFYGSDDAKKHRKNAVKWAADMKKEVMKETKRLDRMSPKVFDAIVDRVAKTYHDIRGVDSEEVTRAAKELKANWDKVQKEAKRVTRTSVSQVKKTGKRVAKRVA